MVLEMPLVSTKKILPVMLFFLAFCGSFSIADEVQADSYAQGVLKSENLLLGSEVESVDGIEVTASVQASTTVRISFSNDRENFYSSDGTKGGQDECQDGVTNIDLSGLGWTDSVLYYKIKLETEDNTKTPKVEEVKLSFTGTAGDLVKANAHQGGVLESSNILSGASVESINGVDITADIPGGTSVKVQFSADGDVFYNSQGEEGGFDDCQDGVTSIDLSGLGWTYPSLYYRLKFDSIDSAMRASVSDVTVDFDGSSDGGPAPNEDGYEVIGGFTSGDLLERRDLVFKQPSYFAYEISYLPSADSVKVQFSNDGESWYNSSGEEGGWDTLSEGVHLYEDSALSLEALDWERSNDFYYRFRLKASSDLTQSPIITKAGISLPGRIRIYSEKNPSASGEEGLVGHFTFNGTNMQWDKTGEEVGDASTNENHGSLEGSLGQSSVARGIAGTQALSFDESQNDHIEATVPATTTISLWYNTGDDWQHLVKNDGSYYVNAVSDTPDTFPVYTDGGTVHIGKDEAGSFVSGKIDDVRIYNRALSEEEIQKLYEKAGQRFVITPREEEADCDDDVWICEQNDVCPSYLGDSDHIIVANEDLGSQYEWGPYGEDCIGPQCEEIEGDMTLVADNSVDFSDYPARDACKAIGGRLPNIDELQCIYNNKTTFGDNFEDATYWSATEFHTYFARRVWLSDGDTYNYYKDYSSYVRCVRGW